MFEAKTQSCEKKKERKKEECFFACFLSKNFLFHSHTQTDKIDTSKSSLIHSSHERHIYIHSK